MRDQTLPLHWGPGILTTGPPGKSRYFLFCVLFNKYYSCPYTIVIFSHKFSIEVLEVNSLELGYSVLLNLYVVQYEVDIYCYLFLSVQVINVCALCLVAQLCLTLCDPMDCSPPSSFVHEDSPGKNTGVAYHDLLQGIFPTQGSNPGLQH